jgi:hypothetical protein
LQNSIEQYKANFKTALVFALLLVFVPVFSSFPNIFISSGSLFMDYNVLSVPPEMLLAEAGLTALFLLFYSFFLSIIIFSVRKGLSKLKLQLYLHEMIQKFTLRIFAFYILFCLLAFLFVSAMLLLGIHILLASLILLIAAFLLMFVPQAVVIDEEGLRHALSTNFDFLLKRPLDFFKIAFVGAVLLALLQLLEFGLAQITLLAPYISLFLALVFILPFLEIMKTYLYLMKIDLIKHHEIARKKKPLPPRIEPEDLASAK